MRWSVDPKVSVVLPSIDEPPREESWIESAASVLLEGREPEIGATHEQVVDVVRAASERAAMSGEARVLLWPHATAAALVLRVAVATGPIDEQALETWRAAPGALRAGPRDFASEGLGAGQLETTLANDEGATAATARWTFVKPGGSLLAILGPVPYEVLATTLPLASALLDVAAVEGLDADGVAFAQQPSLLAEPEAPERWPVTTERS